MPRLGGVKFLKALRQSFLLKDLPIFVLTTTTSSSIHEEAFRAGADKVYVKPDDADALVAIAGEIVADLLRLRRRGGASRDGADGAIS